MKNYNKQHKPITVLYVEEFPYRPHLNEFKKLEHLSNGQIRESFFRKPKEESKIEDSDQKHLLRNN